jgi:hypothetical protein
MTNSWGGYRHGKRRETERERDERHRRQTILGHLQYGPFEWDFALLAHVEPFSDDELRGAFETWAADERAWDERTYAYQRFVVGLSRDDAIAASLVADERAIAAQSN